MDNLIKKLQQMKELLLPTLSKPAAPSGQMNLSQINMPKAPKYNEKQVTKNPIKQAEQIKDPKLKRQAIEEAKIKQEQIAFNKSGQWSLQ